MNVAQPLDPRQPETRGFDRYVRHRRASALESTSRIATGALVGTFAAFVLVIAAFAVFGALHKNHAYPGVSVGEIDFGGMSRSEVRGILDREFASYAGEPIVVNANGESFELSMEQLGLSFDVDATADRVYATGRQGTWWDRSIQWTRAVVSGTRVEPVLIVDNDRFRAGLMTISPDIVSSAQNAYVQMQTGREPRLVDDVPGVSISVDGSRASIQDRIRSLDSSAVELTLLPVPAAVKTSDIAGGLPNARRAVESDVIARSPEGEWGLTPAELRALVSVDDSGSLLVDRQGVESFVGDVAAEIDHPAQDAGITVDENGAFVVVPAVNSARVDVDQTTDDLVSALRNGETSVDITVAREQPAILDSAAQQWADRADRLVGNGLTLTWNGGKAQYGRGDLVAAMVIDPQPEQREQFALSFDETVLADRLLPVTEELYIEPQNARFRLVDGEIRLQSEARQGREVDVQASIASILEAVNGGQVGADVTVTTIEPTVNRDAMASIQLPDVLGQSQTFYGTSSDPRRNNVERAVELENGWLIPPDGVFSYAEVMGLVDEANGFVTGYGIVADPSGGVTTAPVIGGGICQVSTTIFQAAFWSGLPILERFAHPYWLQSYGQPPYGMQGLDAMVNIEPDWALDMQFQNTTGNWIALVMTADGENVRAEIRGTNPGWTIDVPQPQITNVVKPDSAMTYTDSPELPKGEELQVETAQEGFTSRIVRTVRGSDGTVVDEYVVESTYAASRNTTLRGTGGE